MTNGWNFSQTAQNWAWGTQSWGSAITNISADIGLIRGSGNIENATYEQTRNYNNISTTTANYSGVDRIQSGQVLNNAQQQQGYGISSGQPVSAEELEYRRDLRKDNKAIIDQQNKLARIVHNGANDRRIEKNTEELNKLIVKRNELVEEHGGNDGNGSAGDVSAAQVPPQVAAQNFLDHIYEANMANAAGDTGRRDKALSQAYADLKPLTDANGKIHFPATPDVDYTDNSGNRVDRHWDGSTAFDYNDPVAAIAGTSNNLAGVHLGNAIKADDIKTVVTNDDNYNKTAGTNTPAKSDDFGVIVLELASGDATKIADAKTKLEAMKDANGLVHLPSSATYTTGKLDKNGAQANIAFAGQTLDVDSTIQLINTQLTAAGITSQPVVTNPGTGNPGGGNPGGSNPGNSNAVVTTTIADAIVADATGEEAVIYNNVTNYPKFKKSQVEKIQEMLKADGENLGPHGSDGIDGKWGKDTQAAWAAFCAKHNIADIASVDFTDDTKLTAFKDGLKPATPPANTVANNKPAVDPAGMNKLTQAQTDQLQDLLVTGQYLDAKTGKWDDTSLQGLQEMINDYNDNNPTAKIDYAKFIQDPTTAQNGLTDVLAAANVQAGGKPDDNNVAVTPRTFGIDANNANDPLHNFLSDMASKLGFDATGLTDAQLATTMQEKVSAYGVADDGISVGSDGKVQADVGKLLVLEGQLPIKDVKDRLDQLLKDEGITVDANNSLVWHDATGKEDLAIVTVGGKPQVNATKTPGA
jgi:hypothetical protein